MQVCLDLKIGKLTLDSMGVNFRGNAALESSLKAHTTLHTISAMEETKDSVDLKKSIRELIKHRQSPVLQNAKRSPSYSQMMMN